jgi:hypothetical protein
MASIDIGAAAINRSTYTAIKTYVGKENPANDTGSITSVEIWAYSTLSNCEVATFYVVSGDNLSTRDSETIGTVTSGSKQTFSGLNMDVQTGDYLGTYFTAGSLEKDSSGSGYWYATGDYIPCTNSTFNSTASVTISLYGTGETGVTAKTSSDTGSGVDAVDSLETPEAKSSSDAGSGVEDTPVPSAILVSSETGSGIEVLIARLLAALDTGGGAEASSIEIEGLLKALFASELGQGSDSLTAKIEMPTKGGGMKLWT